MRWLAACALVQSGRCGARGANAFGSRRVCLCCVRTREGATCAGLDMLIVSPARTAMIAAIAEALVAAGATYTLPGTSQVTRDAAALASQASQVPGAEAGVAAGEADIMAAAAAATWLDSSRQ